MAAAIAASLRACPVPVPQGQGYISATATNLSTNDTSAFANNAAFDPITVKVTAASPYSLPLGSAYLNLSAPGATSTELAAGVTYTVNWGDSTRNEDVGGLNVSLSHQYLQDGLYSVGVSVTDVNGGGSTATALVVVSSVANDSIVVSGGPLWARSRYRATTALAPVSSTRPIWSTSPTSWRPIPTR